MSFDYRQNSSFFRQNLVALNLLQMKKMCQLRSFGGKILKVSARWCCYAIFRGSAPLDSFLLTRGGSSMKSSSLDIFYRAQMRLGSHLSSINVQQLCPPLAWTAIGRQHLFEPFPAWLPLILLPVGNSKVPTEWMMRLRTSRVFKY